MRLKPGGATVRGSRRVRDRGFFPPTLSVSLWLFMYALSPPSAKRLVPFVANMFPLPATTLPPIKLGCEELVFKMEFLDAEKEHDIIYVSKKQKTNKQKLN